MKDVIECITRSRECQKVKMEHIHPMGFLYWLPILEWKWYAVTIDCITMFPKEMAQHNSIMVVVDKLMKHSHFIPVNSTHKEEHITYIYMKEMTKLHGIPKAIVSYRDPMFTSTYWKGLFKGFGTNLNLSMVYHL